MTARHALIVKIHVAKKQLQLDDGTYRDLLLRAGGHASSKDMSERQLEAVVEEMKRCGFVEPVAHRRREKAPQHVRLIYALWNDLRSKGALSDGSKKALRAFVKRQTQSVKEGGYEAPEFVPADHAPPVIEALKQWVNRTKQARQGGGHAH